MMRMLGQGGVVVVVGGRMMRMLGPGLPGGSGGGCGGLGGCCPAVFSGLLGVGGGCASFLSRSLGWDWRWWGPEGVGLEEGVRSLRGGSLSGGSAGVCMVAFAWLRVRSASLCTVSGGSVGHGSAAGLLLKGWWRWYFLMALACMTQASVGSGVSGPLGDP